MLIVTKFIFAYKCLVLALCAGKGLELLGSVLHH